MRRLISMNPITMFRLFPKYRQDWLQVFAFPFQAYVILAPVSYYYLLHIWPHRGEVGTLNNFAGELSFGYLICFLVLLAFGLSRKAAGHRLSAYVSLFLSALSIFFIFLTSAWIQL